MSVEQNGKSYPVFSLDRPTQATTRQDAADRFYVMRPIGKRAIPDLQAGPARIVVHAARPVMRGLRQVESETTRDVQVRLEPPQVVGRSRRFTTSISAAPSSSSIARRRRTSSRACASATARIPAFPAPRSASERPRRARRVLRTVVRPGREHADQRLRTRSRGQRRRRRPSITCRSPSRFRTARSRSTAGSRASCRRSSPTRRR